ncbi:HEAT repeat domain-containing protein [Rubellimicrobium rubrum]|uniref:HEAT repeat domain-containing protein n=1 Tax=Rubellimicrobium rubrum TaxID=2585369 RepID=UPI00159BE493|nr:HEAT repeat domain-containing protein [Rubellimicrobium rubrum]
MRRGTTTPPTSEAAPPSRADLEAVDAHVRRGAARRLSVDPGAADALGRAFGVEGDPSVREAILAALVRIGGVRAVEAVLPYLRSDDAALRTGALDVLKSLPESVECLPALLDDPDADLRVLAAEVARAMPNGAALLCRRLLHEHDPNVCAAALDVLAEIGGPDCLPSLQVCAERYVSEPFLRYAVATAVARIGGSQAPGS